MFQAIYKSESILIILLNNKFLMLTELNYLFEYISIQITIKSCQKRTID